jgi:hypothetical protein
MKTMNQIQEPFKAPDLGDPMTQMYYDLVKALGSYASRYPEDLDENRMWQVIRKLDAIFQYHMRELIEEASVNTNPDQAQGYHPAAQYIMDRLIRENQA